MALQRKSSFSSRPPQQVHLKQAVSCSDITKRVHYIEQCVKNHCPVDMRQMVNLYRLAEMYNSAVKKQKQKKVAEPVGVASHPRKQHRKTLSEGPVLKQKAALQRKVTNPKVRRNSADGAKLSYRNFSFAKHTAPLRRTSST